MPPKCLVKLTEVIWHYPTGRRASAVGAMCSSGMLDCIVHADTFYDFKQRLCKCLMPFNGRNPNSVAALDNCAIHL